MRHTAENATKCEYYSVPQVAGLLGISRIAVFKKVKRGDIKATRIGKSYAIRCSDVQRALGKSTTSERKREIKKAVKKVVKEYGPLLIRLGNE